MDDYARLLVIFLDPVLAWIPLAVLVCFRSSWAILPAGLVAAVAGEALITSLRFTHEWGETIGHRYVAHTAQAGLYFVLLLPFRRRQDKRRAADASDGPENSHQEFSRGYINNEEAEQDPHTPGSLESERNAKPLSARIHDASGEEVTRAHVREHAHWIVALLVGIACARLHSDVIGWYTLGLGTFHLLSPVAVAILLAHRLRNFNFDFSPFRLVAWLGIGGLCYGLAAFAIVYAGLYFWFFVENRGGLVRLIGDSMLVALMCLGGRRVWWIGRRYPSWVLGRAIGSSGWYGRGSPAARMSFT